MSPALRLDLSQHRLVCCCEDCDHFDAAATERGATGSGACDLLFPTAPHRRATWESAADGDALSFCKLFEPDRGDDVAGFDRPPPLAGSNEI